MQFLAHLRPMRSSIRATRFLLFLIASATTIFLISIFNSANFDFGRSFYVIAFLNVSVIPYFFLDRNRGQYLLIAVFLPIYFLLFCLGDLVSVLGIESKAVPETGSLETRVDQVIVFGGISYIIGYLVTTRAGKAQWKGWFREEWHHKKTRIAGLACWMLGTWAFITIYFFSKTSSLPLSIVSNLKSFSQLGSLIIIYLYVARREFSTLMILLFMGIFDFILGFVADTKEVSFVIPALYVMLSFVLKGRVNKTFVAAIIVIAIGYTFFFNAYRLWVIQIRNQTPIEALQNIDRSIELVINNAGKKDIDNPEAVSHLKERIETRKYIVYLVDGIEDKGIATMDGHTLWLFFQSFIPRVLWPEKPEISIGRLFNKEFHLSASPLTYIPATQLGEFYWNFKMPGVLIGMTGVGIVMAFISKMSDLSVKVTLPRILILLMTIYLICLRFEVDTAQQYSLLVRVLAFIFLLDLILRKRSRQKHTLMTSPNKRVIAQ